MSSQTIPTRMTPDEYLEWEATQEDRYEYIDGEIRAMSGATLDHNRIVMNIAGETRQCLQESPCEGFTTSQKVQTKAGLSVFYPDVLIVCEDLQEGRGNAILNPIAIFEVLSPSTGRYDRCVKFERYRTIENLQEYFLVHQNKAMIEAYRRSTDGTWDVSVYMVYVGLGAIFTVDSVGIKLPLKEIYRRVSLDALELPDGEASEGPHD